MGNEKLKEAKALCEFLEEQRRTWDDRGKLVTKYLLPQRGRWWNSQDSNPNDGKSRAGAIMDGKGMRAMRVMAAGMQGGLTPPSNRWFRIRLEDPDLMEFGPVRIWLDDVTDRLYWALQRSNFYTASHAMYTELGGFGSGCVGIDRHPDRLVHFRVLTFGSFAWGCDYYGFVDTNVRRGHFPLHALAKQYGEDALPKKQREALKKTPYEMVQVLDVIRPRAVDPSRIDRLNLPFEHSLFLADASEEDGFLHVGGYEHFPMLCARWDIVADEVYGRGPGQDALPDARLLTELTKSQLMAIQKVVNPPMRVPALYAKRLSHIPGAQNQVSASQQELVQPLYQIQPDVGAISAKIEDVRQALSEGFFNDLFLMMAYRDQTQKGVITATEVVARQQEKMLVLGPVVERLQSEYLEPAINQVYDILLKEGEIPPPPEEIAGKVLKIEYVSILGQAQKISSGQSILSFLTLAAQAAQAQPEVLDKIDFDQVIDEYHIMTGAPARIVRADRVVAKMRTERARAKAEQEAAAMAAQAAQTGADSMKTLSETSVQGQSALDRLMGTVQ
jgi:hypothetical protein